MDLRGRGRETARRVRSVLTVMSCVGLLIATEAMAQEAAESGAVARTATAPLSNGPMQMTISMGPQPAAGAHAPAPSVPLRGPSCAGPVRGEQSVMVPLGKSVLVPLDEPVRNRTLGNPAIAQATMVSPQTLYVLGEAVGTTNMIIQGRSGACQVIDVVVNADAGGLQASLQQLLPEEHDIRVSTAADNLVLMGHVSTPQAAQQAAQIAAVYSVSHGANGNGSKGGVLNMLSVDSPQQVMLEVKVAEVDKTLIDQLGAAVNIQGGFGSWSGVLVSNLLAGVSSAVAFSKANNKPLQFAADAQKTDNLVKILAEPNLVTISGQEATFLAGGEIFIPVPQSGSNGTLVITLQPQEFGVGLRFTPTVLGNGRINLKVAPEVSELSPTGVTLTTSSAASTSVLPLITTRRASTTVQMRDGESFAIGGLISNNVTGSLKALPGIGELPVLGTLFRSTSFQQDRSELVFIVTPHLVHPMPATQYRMPTDSFTQANEADVYATGNMEGRGAAGAFRGQPAGAAPAAPAAPAVPSAPAVPVSSRTLPASGQDGVTASAAPAPVVSSVPLPSPESAAERVERAARRIAASGGQNGPRIPGVQSGQSGQSGQSSREQPATGQPDAAQPTSPAAAQTPPAAPAASDQAHVAYLARVNLTTRQGGTPPAPDTNADH